MRTILKNMIEHALEGHVQIIETDDGLAAIKLCKQEKPDCVLMDIQLKGMDGLAATKQITQSNKQIKVMIVTMYDEEAYRKAAVEAGAHSYVLKENMYNIPLILRQFFLNR